MPSFTGSGDWAKDDVGFSVGETLAGLGLVQVKGVEGKSSGRAHCGMEATDGVRTCNLARLFLQQLRLTLPRLGRV